MWLDLKAAAEYLGVGERNLRRFVSRRAIRHRQLTKGGCIDFKREWLDEFSDKHTVAPAEPPRHRSPRWSDYAA